MVKKIKRIFHDMTIKRTSNVSTDKMYWNTAPFIHLHSPGCFCARRAELNTCNREATPKNLLSGPFKKKFADFARDGTR